VRTLSKIMPLQAMVRFRNSAAEARILHIPAIYVSVIINLILY